MQELSNYRASTNQITETQLPRPEAVETRSKCSCLRNREGFCIDGPERYVKSKLGISEMQNDIIEEDWKD